MPLAAVYKGGVPLAANPIFLEFFFSGNLCVGQAFGGLRRVLPLCILYFFIIAPPLPLISRQVGFFAKIRPLFFLF